MELTEKSMQSNLTGNTYDDWFFQGFAESLRSDTKF